MLANFFVNIRKRPRGILVHGVFPRSLDIGISDLLRVKFPPLKVALQRARCNTKCAPYFYPKAVLEGFLGVFLAPRDHPLGVQELTPV